MAKEYEVVQDRWQVMRALLDAIRENCGPRVWSRGVELARQNKVLGEKIEEDTVFLLVAGDEQLASHQVQLFCEDLDWCCNCDLGDPCQHVVAAAIAYLQAKAKNLQLPQSTETARIRYGLLSPDGFLTVARFLDSKASPFVAGSPDNLPLKGDLTKLVASGQLMTSQYDLTIDNILNLEDQPLPPRSLKKLIKCLAQIKDVCFETIPVNIVMENQKLGLLIEDMESGVKLSLRKSGGTIFKNGAVFFEYSQTLKPLHLGKTSRLERGQLEKGLVVARADLVRFVSESMGRLEGDFALEIKGRNLPHRTKTRRPYLLLNISRFAEQGMFLFSPTICYGRPKIAETCASELLLIGNEAPTRDLGREAELKDQLRRVLGLEWGRKSSMDERRALKLVELAKAEGIACEGEEIHTFRRLPALCPKVEIKEDGFTLGFECQDETGNVRQASWRAVSAGFSQGENLVPLIGGGFSPLPREFLSQHFKVLSDLMAAQELTKTIPRAQLHELSKLAQDLNLAVPPDVLTIKSKIEEAKESSPIDMDKITKRLKGTLRSYQCLGVQYLANMQRLGIGCLLADDMGLGKTIQAIAVLERETLVIAPTSVLYNWERELSKFRPDLLVNIYHGAKRTLGACDVVLTSFGVLRSDQESLGGRQWKIIVVDEAQHFKNPDSQIAQTIYGLKADFKLTLTGTPIENRLAEIWSQFHFLNQGLLGSQSYFENAYVGDEGVARLSKRLAPFYLRRLKQDVAKELPKKTETILRAEFTPREREVYQSLLAASQKEVRAKMAGTAGEKMKIMDILEILLRLRQACCHLGLIPGQSQETSSKLELLLAKLEETLAENHRALIFSQWTSFLDLIEASLEARGLPFLRIDGSTAQEKRGDRVDRFQRGETPLLLMSLKAGGVGLNLTAADYVFILDPWWNPAVESQAADRAHRIGQVNPVFIYKLIVSETVEEQIIALQSRKKALANALMGTSDLPAVSAAELLQLIEHA